MGEILWVARDVQGGDRAPRSGARGGARGSGARGARLPEARLLQRRAPTRRGRPSSPTAAMEVLDPEGRPARSRRSRSRGCGRGSCSARVRGRSCSNNGASSRSEPARTRRRACSRSSTSTRSTTSRQARARHAVEDEWYRERGEDDWRAERQAHRAYAEFRAGQWDLAEELVEESCATIARLEQPGAMGDGLSLPLDRRRRPRAGRSAARETLLPLHRGRSPFGARPLGSAHAVDARLRRVRGRRPQGGR